MVGWFLHWLASPTRIACILLVEHQNVRKFCWGHKKILKNLQWGKPAVSRQAVRGWGTSTSGLCGFSDLATARFRILSQFLEAQLCSAENFSESLDWILGDWWDFISPRRESELVHYLSLAVDYKPGTVRLNVHVSPADETCDIDKSDCSFSGEHAGHPCWWADLCAPPPQKEKTRYHHLATGWLVQLLLFMSPLRLRQKLTNTTFSFLFKLGNFHLSIFFSFPSSLLVEQTHLERKRLYLLKGHLCEKI